MPDDSLNIQLPFTIVSGGVRTAAHGTERSTGYRLGLFWEEIDGSVVITGVKPNGPAAMARAFSVGDVIVEADGTSVRGLADVVQILAAKESGTVSFAVKGASGSEPRKAAVRLPPLPVAADESGEAPAAHVPTVSLRASLLQMIECALSNPVQSEVTHEGVAADPKFGCLGSDLEFSIEKVTLSSMRNAIVASEPRLEGPEVSQVPFEVRRDGELHVEEGIRVEGRVRSTGERVQLDFEVPTLARRRRTNQLRRPGREGGMRTP